MACIPAAQGSGRGITGWPVSLPRRRQGRGLGWPVSLVGLRSRRPPTFPTSRWVTAQENSGRAWPGDGLYPGPVCAPGARRHSPSRWVTAQEQHQGARTEDASIPARAGSRAVVGGLGCRQAGATGWAGRARCGHPVPAAAAPCAPAGRPERAWRGPSGLADEADQEQQDHRTDEGVRDRSSRPPPMATPSRGSSQPASTAPTMPTTILPNCTEAAATQNRGDQPAGDAADQKGDEQAVQGHGGASGGGG